MLDTLWSSEQSMAERLLFGCILREPLALQIARPLTADDFSGPSHALILATLRQLDEDGLPLNVPTLTTRLERTGQLQRVGGSGYLAALVEAAPAPAPLQQATALVQQLLACRDARPSAARSASPAVGIEPAPAAVSGARTADLTPDAARARLEARAPTLQTVDALLRQNLATTLWIVPDLLPEGLTLLAAKPKLGKSWLALGLALAVASGGTALGALPVAAGAVLYLALEDSPRRLRQRVQQVLRGAEAPAALEVATQWPRLDSDGLRLVELWLGAHPAARLVIIDTLAKIRGAKAGGSYIEDYASLEAVQALAQRAGVGILMVHHTGKESREDPLDEVNATQGLNGVADNILVLRRQRGKLEASLIGDGRELNGVELTLRFDPAAGAWTLTEPEPDGPKTPERAEILELLKASEQPMSPRQVAEALGKSASNVGKLLLRMTHAGDITMISYGKYAATPVPSVPSIPSSFASQQGEVKEDRYSLMTERTYLSID